METAAEKMIALAEAMPEEAYAWRPSEGVRSVSEVYMHVAGTNYWFPTVVGGEAPAGSGVTADYATVPPLEGVTEKEAIVTALRTSFEFVIDFIRNAPADRLDDDINMFGQATTYRGVLIETSVHLHEHLGQSIAYARANGVAPPWGP
ncbi:MAG: DinB family protein, partial [Longimicrobiales bacterium]